MNSAFYLRHCESVQRLLIVGNPELIHIGSHLQQAARSMGLPVELCDTRTAFDVHKLVLQFNWHLRGHYPPHLRRFSRYVVDTCRAFEPTWLLTVGIAPVESRALEEIRRMGVICLNYLTDDPWNHFHYAAWFMKALPNYDWIFSPRRANLDDLGSLGCRRVTYLPFAYAPELHFPELSGSPEEMRQFTCDVVFFGGADQDRLPHIQALVQNGLDVHLYGGYWEHFPTLRRYTRGVADPGTLRRAVGGAKVTLCLVRRSNRDGHVMRTFEAPAMGACMLAEDTMEHREILGAEGAAVIYFRTVNEMVERVHWLLNHADERRRLAAAAHTRIVNQPNTYRDRLTTMLSMVGYPYVSVSHVTEGN